MFAIKFGQIRDRGGITNAQEIRSRQAPGTSELCLCMCKGDRDGINFRVDMSEWPKQHQNRRGEPFA